MVEDFVNQLIAWEEGSLDADQELALFQKLVDNGLAWTLQGLYGRRASQLLRDGLIQPKARTAPSAPAVQSTDDTYYQWKDGQWTPLK